MTTALTHSHLAKPAACGLCLILMFLGSWTADSAVLALVDLPGNYVSLRLVTLLAYGLVFAALVFARGHFTTNTPLLHNPSLIRSCRFALAGGALLLAIGCVCLLGLHEITPHWLLLVFALLIKSAGPVLSITALVLFAALRPRYAVKAAVFSYALAFFGECLLRLLFEAVSADPAPVLIVGALLLCAGCFVASRTLTSLAHESDAEGAQRSSANDAPQSLPGNAAPQNSLFLQSVAQFSTSRGSVIKALVFIGATALMLGFMKSGASSGNSVSLLAAVIVLIALGAMAFCLERVDMRALFVSAVVCLSAALLLEPVIGLLGAGISRTLADTATILFEIFIWVVAVALVRASHNAPLRAASVRFATVIGHTIGTVVAVAALTLSLSFSEAVQTASFALLFVYIILLIVFSRNVPNPDQPGESNSSAERAEPPATPATAHDLTYWTAPCELLADEHALTPRETEVLIQLAQGRDLAFMENKFVLSRNTVKMHVRNVYAKLGVYSKQEVIDLVDQARARGV